MQGNNFFSEVFNKYSQVKVKKENRDFYNLNTIVYYLADIEQNIISARNVYEIDIRSAFPTICRLLFTEEKEFIKKLDELQADKLARNIFISTTLKGTEYLKQLNLIAKMIISSVLMDADPEAKVLELKKDGIVYIGNTIEHGQLYNYFTNIGFTIRITRYPLYLRYSRTSYYLSDDDKRLIIKGVFKDRPPFLQNVATDLVNRGRETVDFELLDKVYSKKYFEIIRQNSLDELLSKYYICDGRKYLNDQFRYDKLKTITGIKNLSPKNYLKLFIYPLLTILREN